MASDELQNRSVECNHCGQVLKAASLANHLETQHDVFRSRVIGQDILLEREEIVHRARATAQGVSH